MLAAGGVIVVAVAAVLPFVLKSPPKSRPSTPPASTSSTSSTSSPSATTSTALATAATGAQDFHSAPLSLPGAFPGRKITSLVFSPLNGTLAIADNDLCLWDLAAARCAAQFPAAAAVAFSADGKTLAASGLPEANLDPNLRLVDVAAGSQIFYAKDINDATVPSSGLNSVAFSPDNKTVAVGDLNGTTFLWDATTRRAVTRVSDPVGTNAVAFALGGTVLAAGGVDGTTYLWNVATGQQQGSLPGMPVTGSNSLGVAALAVSPNGRQLAVAEDSQNGRGVYLWDVAAKRKLSASPLTDPGSLGVRSVAFCPDGKTLAVADLNGSAYLWNIDTAKVTAILRDPAGQPVIAVAFGPSGDTVATGDKDGNVYLWSQG
jgi:WD40 repeat protein